MNARLIVCEKTGRWALGWRRALPHAEWGRLQQTRSLLQCEEALRACPHSVVAVAATEASAEFVLAALRAWNAQFADCRALVLLAPELAPLSLAFLAAGAQGRLLAPRELPRWGRWVRRHWARAPAEPSPLSLREAVWRRLPWPALASRDK